MIDWNDKVKRLLKSELPKRGISNSDLVIIFEKIGVKKIKASIDNKISRGSFSTCFLFQCLTAIGSKKVEIENYKPLFLTTAETNVEYHNKA